MKTLFTLAMGLWLAGCGLIDRKGDGSGPQIVSLSGFGAFQQLFYPQIRSRCVDCHGKGTGPQFAADDANGAYSVARGYANFSDIPRSRFVDKVRDGHCGAHCSTDGSEMVAWLQAWWDGGENPALHDVPIDPSRFSVILPELAVPATLPFSSSGQYATMTWDLGFAGLTGCRFMVDIQMFDSESYRFRRPRIQTPAGTTVYARETALLINGVFSEQNNAFMTVDITVPANATTNLSAAFLVALQESPADTLSFAFTELRKP